ncbi:hypothetical protein [Streptomyces sp. NPDC018045]|uniref:hypothetical protein n=1 Tax=Streptomyces sp. NPDC018045 TaxID=3365037 RepID=UPI0037B14FF9
MCILLLGAFVGYVMPWATAVWGGAVLVALIMRWAAYRAARKGRASRLARTPRLAYFVLCVPWALAVVPFESAGTGVLGMGWSLVLLPFVLLVTTGLVCAGDRLLARATLAVLSRDDSPVGRIPWVAPKAGRRLAGIGKDQTRPELPYDAPERFVGAGREVWGPAHIDIPLKAKEPGRSPGRLGQSELLHRIGMDLSELGHGAREITDPLPGFSMEKVNGLPSVLWLQGARDAEPEPPDLRGLGRSSSSSVPNRLYLRAQCISWSGQVVVSVFVHAALEARELRLTVRPHVNTPLYNDLRVTVAPAGKRGLRLLGWLTVQSLLDSVAGPVTLWRLAARLGEKTEARVAEKDPVSLRDRYSTEEVVDMHMSDDAKRHVVLMQTCVFRTVAVYLDELGIDTAAYERQVAAVITNIQVFGDNNAPIQNVAGSGISDVRQKNTDQGDN